MWIAQFERLVARGTWTLGNGHELHAGGTRMPMLHPIGGIEIVNIPGGAGNPPVSSFRFLAPFTPPPACPAGLDGDGPVDGIRPGRDAQRVGLLLNP